jgi:hypothetical protein
MKTIILLAALLAGCVSTQPKIDTSNSQAVLSNINIEHDNYKKATKYSGPEIDTGSGAVFIRAFHDHKSNIVAYQIYLADQYRSTQWRFYSDAYDSDGTRLETNVIDRKVFDCAKYTGCFYTEHIGINIPESYLETKKNTGINIKVSGKAGEKIISIPAGYVKAFISAVRKSQN